MHYLHAFLFTVREVEHSVAMGNLGSKKKPKEDEVIDGVWVKLNDGQRSPKEKKKKKKKRKKKGKVDSPDGCEDDASQYDSYSQSTLSSRKLSDSTIASVGTITHQKVENETKQKTDVDVYNVDDQSNCSIGYITASDTFTPPSPRKSRPPKFSPVIAQDSPRVVRRLLQSDKILENNVQPVENLSPRAKFFLSTPETPKSTKMFDNRKYKRHSSGSSIDSRTFLAVPDDRPKPTLSPRINDNRYITNGSLIIKSRQQESKNSPGYDSRFSNNSLDLSDSTTENLVKTGEKAKLIRYDGGNLSPAERRKNRHNEELQYESNNRTTNKLPFVKYDYKHPKQGVREDFIDFLITDDSQSEQCCKVKSETCRENNQKPISSAQGSQLEIVPPPTPASVASLIEVDECAITEIDSSSDKNLSRDDVSFRDSVCKRLSLLLESEQDSSKLNRSEFSEFTDSVCSSPDIPKYVCKSGTVSERISGRKGEISLADKNKQVSCSSKEDSFVSAKSTMEVSAKSTMEGVSKLEIICDVGSSVTNTVKTPQGKENASVLDVMNNNFRTKTEEQVVVGNAEDRNLARADVFRVSTNDGIIQKRDNSKEEYTIEEQMRIENEINEKRIAENVKMLQDILPPPSEENKRNSLLCAIGTKHANDPDNYILVTKKTYGVKKGILVELMDEEKDVIARDAIKTLNEGSDVSTVYQEVYKPDAMIVEQGKHVICPLSDDDDRDSYSDISESISEPDYVNLESFERQENDFDDISQSDEGIDYENVLNRSQSQSDSGSSDVIPNVRTDIYGGVIGAYKDDGLSEYSDELSEGDILYIEEPRSQEKFISSNRADYSEISEDEILCVKEPRTQNWNTLAKYSDEIYEDEILCVKEPSTQNRNRLAKYSDEISEDEILFVNEPRTHDLGKSTKFVDNSDKILGNEIIHENIPDRSNREHVVQNIDYLDDILGDEMLYSNESNVHNRKRISKHFEYSDDSDSEILYAEEACSSSTKVIRTPSKLDQSLQKIFHVRQKQLKLSNEPSITPSSDNQLVLSAAKMDDRFQTGGYDSPQHKSSDGSRRSLAFTESDLDASEQWDDDDASNDSMLADDEDDDDEIGEILFSKPYMEHDDKTDVFFSYNMVKTLPESPVMWQPEAEDDEVFEDAAIGVSGYQPELDSLDSSDEAFDDARKQMQEIHEQLQTLREQMVTFENEEEESSLPTSPTDDRISHIPKASTE